MTRSTPGVKMNKFSAISASLGLIIGMYGNANGMSVESRRIATTINIAECKGTIHENLYESSALSTNSVVTELQIACMIDRDSAAWIITSSLKCLDCNLERYREIPNLVEGSDHFEMRYDLIKSVLATDCRLTRQTVVAESTLKELDSKPIWICGAFVARDGSKKLGSKQSLPPKEFNLLRVVTNSAQELTASDLFKADGMPFSWDFLVSAEWHTYDVKGECGENLVTC